MQVIFTNRYTKQKYTSQKKFNFTVMNTRLKFKDRVQGVLRISCDESSHGITNPRSQVSRTTGSDCNRSRRDNQIESLQQVMQPLIYS